MPTIKGHLVTVADSYSVQRCSPGCDAIHVWFIDQATGASMRLDMDPDQAEHLIRELQVALAGVGRLQ
jgi:hypothetical protein